MKNLILILFFTLILFQLGCDSNISKKKSTTTQEVVASEKKTPSLDEIRAFRDTPEYQAIKDSGHLILNQFYELYDAEKHDNAVELYFKNKGKILVALETTTEIYNFHLDYIIPLIENTIEEDEEVFNLVIDILELDLVCTELVIEKSDWKKIPEHYGSLMSKLGQFYFWAGMYEKAIENNDKIFNYLDEVSVPDSSQYFGRQYYNRGIIYNKMNNSIKALECFQKSKRIFEHLDMQDEEVYLDCLNLIETINKAQH